MRPVSITRTLAAAVANAICLAQTTAGAGNLLLNGALVSGGVATIAAPSQVTLTSAGNDSAVNFTITGTDYRGVTVSEVLAGPNANTVTSVNTYKTVTQIAVSGAVGTNVTVGNAQSGSSPVVVMDRMPDPCNLVILAKIAGVLNVTVQYTSDDVFTSGSLDALVWSSVATMANLAATADGNVTSPVSGIRALTNSGNGTLTLRINQAGLQG